MKIEIDLKSAICGLLAGVAIMFCVGAGTSSNPVGRFQLKGAPGGNGVFFAILDTQTGEVWGLDTVKNWNDELSRWPDFWKPK